MDNIPVKATREEILGVLYRQLGPEAVQVCKQVDKLISTNKNNDALVLLKKYDSTLGGVGIHSFPDNQKPPGIYRAFAYVASPIRSLDAITYTRFMISSSCAYLEELIKKLVWTWPWDRAMPDRLPLGSLVNKIKKRLPKPLSADLFWLATNVYNFAKHQFNVGENDEETGPYFGMDEAIAVYLIVRKLGLEVELQSGKTLEQFEEEY